MKKLFATALIACAFAACGKDDEPVVLPDPPAQQEPYILYWDQASATLAAGQWGSINYNNLLQFKFGSVVGFTAPGVGDAWNAADAVFNPTGEIYTFYRDVPYYDGGAQAPGYISSSEYHNGANVKAGKGDPCRLVGLGPNATAEQINAHDSGLRMMMPQDVGNIYGDFSDFVWTESPAKGRRLASNPTPATFLPISFPRADYQEGKTFRGPAIYWADEVIVNPNDPDDTAVEALIFTEESVFSSGYGVRTNGGLMRCVRDE